MGLFGSLVKNGTIAAVQQMDENREARINLYEQNGIIRFAGNDEFVEYYDLPITYFGVPENIGKKDAMYETVAKMLGSEEYQQIASQGLTYCIMVDSVFGRAANGTMFHEKGIFNISICPSFIPREKMVEMGVDKKGWVYINDSDGVKNYLSGAGSKKIKAVHQKVMQLLRQLYGI